jgi:hypothetical protein
MPACVLVVLAPSVEDDDYWPTLKPQIEGRVAPPLRSANVGGWRFTWYYPSADRVSFSITRVDADGETLLHHLSVSN